MKIQIKQSFKSLIANKEVELPDFCVLTGKNGSGKSHFLESMTKKGITNILDENEKIINFSDVRYVLFNGLNPQFDKICDSQILKENLNQYIQAYKQVLPNLKQPDAVNKLWIWEDASSRYGINSHVLRELVKRVAQRVNKEIYDVTEDDIRWHADIAGIDSNDAFKGQFAKIFKAYQIRVEENIYHIFRNKEYGDHYKTFSEEEFEKTFGPKPWVIVDNLLKEARIPYSVSNPEGSDLDSAFTFSLNDYEKGIEIQPTDLSTGEKVMMSLALAIYNSGKDNIKNKVLLIDEPDAALHPEFSNFLLTAIKKHIVDGAGVKVIITTHSPTTVAMAEEEWIYEMDKEEKIPKKVTKQKALSILTADIPSLRVSIDKRRVVFVESDYDAANYEKIFELVNPKIKLDIQPAFFAPHNKNGSSCSDVKELLAKLVGTNGVYGVVDYDGGNNVSSEKVKVMGENGERRYTIENYIFDPIFVGLAVLRDNIAPNAPQIDYAHFDDLETIAKQGLIDWVMNELGLNNGSRVKYETISSEILEINSDWVQLKGHALEDKILNKWPAFNRLKQGNKGDNALKSTLLNTVIKNYPQYLSMDFKRLFESLC